MQDDDTTPNAMRLQLTAFDARLVSVLGVVLLACQSSPARDSRDTSAASVTSGTAQVADAQCSDDARRTVEQLGLRLRQVSVLAPPEAAARSMAEAYGELVTPELLAAWQRTPANAPGRETSNPWPARIEIDSTHALDHQCRVVGDIILVTTADTTTAVDRRAVTALLADSNGWRVTRWEPAAIDRGAGDRAADVADTAGAVTVLRHYFSLIADRKYDSAYVLWADAGRASRQTPAEFAAGYRETTAVHATVGRPIRVEGAAGSQYATLPVSIDAVLRNGRHQRFQGTYTLRRSMVDGATAEQRSWRIYAATMREPE